MSFENFPKSSSRELPKEINLEQEQKPLIEITEGLNQGKKYKYEKNGEYYGGDFLDELPGEIDLDLPPPPPENNMVI